MKKTILLLASIAATVCALANPVDRQTAAKAAAGFWQNTLHRHATAQMIDLCDSWHYSQLYLFTTRQGGFILMAANDVARPVLAYSTSSSLNLAQLPAPLLPLLQQYQQEITAASQSKSLAPDPAWQRLLSGLPLTEPAKDSSDLDTLAPLIPTQWGQMSPYNQLCPPGCMTGCVATSASQVMRYWKYPAFGQGTHSYTTDGGYGVLSADFAHTRYDWDNMPAQLSGSSPANQRNAVATLMLHAGISVNMNYSPMQSGASAGDHDGDTNAYCTQNALWRFFHYNRSDLRYIEKGNTSNQDWTSMLIDELRLRRPILYDGDGAGGGHSFICDGYDSRRYLHFNLGNDGSGDGYYAIGAINYGSYGFNHGNACVTGIHPEYGIYLSDPTLAFDRTGGTQQLWLSLCDTVDAPWSARSSADWITLADTSFSRLGELSVVVTENNTGHERTGTVLFAQRGLTATLTVTQSAYSTDDYCPLTVVMENTRIGNAWANDAYLSFQSPSGLVYGTASHTSTNRFSTVQVMVAPSEVIVKYHKAGPQDRNYNYWVINQHGDTVVSVVNAYYNSHDVTIPWPCSPAGIESADTEAQCTLFPNPAQGQLTIHSLRTLRSVSLVNAAGQRVFSRTAIGDTRCSIATASLPRGFYWAVITTTDGTLQRKIILN